jgi:hypothetical protein
VVLDRGGVVSRVEKSFNGCERGCWSVSGFLRGFGDRDYSVWSSRGMIDG